MLSVRPNWTAKILNGKKTIEVRKKFPKDYVGWVYIYCTKGNGYLTDYGISKTWCFFKKGNDIFKKEQLERECYNGKVVARFWCDKVEEFDFIEEIHYFDDIQKHNEIIDHNNYICRKSCLSGVQMVLYLDTKCLGTHQDEMLGYAIHISKLEVFDKPKELSEFGIKRAPQNYCYIEGEE